MPTYSGFSDSCLLLKLAMEKESLYVRLPCCWLKRKRTLLQFSSNIIIFLDVDITCKKTNIQFGFVKSNYIFLAPNILSNGAQLPSF